MGTGHSNKVIGQAGEFAVCAQLGKLGLVATPFSGNVPHFDVLISDEHLHSLPVQVKATYGNDSWIVGDARDWMEIDFDSESGRQTIRGPSRILHPDLITVYVWLSKSAGQLDRYFVLTKFDVQKILIEGYQQWLGKHNGIRPKKPDSYHIIIGLCELLPFENNWKIIRARLDLDH
jgi:hypothetical protein